jgi:2-phosphosulfolactate phosphatase
VPAGSRKEPGYSLSPPSLQSIPAGTAIVLPSPNGSALSLEAAAEAATYCACLRNAPAVAARLSATARRVNLIPAGEQWHDGSLRPCVEDPIGAGAAIAGLSGSLSPEAELAREVFESFRSRLHETIRNCVSGLELIERGFPRDIDLAADYAVSACVPSLRGDRFE